MADITIAASMTNVTKGVQLISAKEGLKHDDFDKALKAEDDNSIEAYEKEAAYALLNTMGKFCTGLSPATDKYTYTLSMPSNWGSSAAKVLPLVEQFFINFVVSRWFGIVQEQKADTYATQAATYEAIVFKELIIRNKPSR